MMHGMIKTTKTTYNINMHDIENIKKKMIIINENIILFF
jgi:hypothetical protein